MCARPDPDVRVCCVYSYSTLELLYAYTYDQVFMFKQLLCFNFLAGSGGRRKVYLRMSDGRRAESVREAHEIEAGQAPRRVKSGRRDSNVARTERRRKAHLETYDARARSQGALLRPGCGSRVPTLDTHHKRIASARHQPTPQVKIIETIKQKQDDYIYCQL